MDRLLKLCLVCVLMTACGANPGASSLAGDQSDRRYPQHPHTEMTPGERCSNPDTYRYPENIAYCERNVSTSTKQAIIAEYDERFGYEIGEMDRQEFKIDHFFPLCMGGSNGRANLWPQHKTVYTITDSMEQKLCELMADGDMQQSEAMDTIRHAKFNLDEVPQIMDQLEARSR